MGTIGCAGITLLPKFVVFAWLEILPRTNTFRPPLVESEAIRHTSVTSAPSTTDRFPSHYVCLVLLPVG